MLALCHSEFCLPLESSSSSESLRFIQTQPYPGQKGASNPYGTSELIPMLSRENTGILHFRYRNSTGSR